MRPSQFAPLLLLAGPAQAATVSDEQFWFNFSATGALAPGLMLNTEFQPRWREGGGETSQLLGRIGLGRPLSSSAVLWGGYVYNHLPTDGGRDVTEQRVYQQLSVAVGALAGGQLSTRTRLEQRWRSSGSGTGWRLRQQVRFVRPLAGPVSGVLSGEAMAELADTRWGARKGFEQSRLFVGVAIPLGAGVTVEPGYLNQVQNRPRGQTAVNHAVVTSVYFRY